MQRPLKATSVRGLRIAFNEIGHDAKRRGRERFGSRSVDAAAPGCLKLSQRAWNEYACAIAKRGASTINLDEKHVSSDPTKVAA